MKPVHSIKNQYRGINAHLHSLLLKQGGWSELHNSYLQDMFRAMRNQLLPRGYTVGLEQSVQIRRVDDSQSDWQSDVTIYDPDPIRQRVILLSMGNVATAELILPNIEALEDDSLSESPYRAISIRNKRRNEAEQPIVWIELLSPSNKPGGQDYLAYITKRRDVLDNEVVFVEIDYLHEYPSTILGLPRYYNRKDHMAEEGSHPYHILVIEPRPSVRQGHTHVYQFYVDTPIPTVTIPLSDNDVLKFDFNAPYHRMLQETLFALERVDYTELPLNFDRYSPHDQTRIVRRMVAVLQAAQKGVDLETAPFEIEPLTLEEGLASLNELKSE